LASIISLQTISDSVLVQDMNYDFGYKRVKDPDGSDTPYFSLSYRESGQPWLTCNGLLSEEYQVAKTSEIIKDIQASLGAKTIGEKHFRDKTSVKSIFILKDYVLDIPGDTDVDKILFNLMTNLNLEEITSKTGLAFGIINGFSGNLALQLNYSFVTALFGDKEDGTKAKASVSNPFVLDEFTHRLIHDDTLNLTYEQVKDVKSKCEDRINKFKQIPVDIDFLTGLTKAFPKKLVRTFIEMQDNLNDEFRNLYYASFILSYLIDADKNIVRELELRKYLSAFVAKKDGKLI
jgi:hypothetical protein